jgi:ADP-heptose:LPS heptosyltransferase
MELPFIHFDCKLFDGDRPCKPNKEYGVFCSNCSYFEKDEMCENNFPGIKYIEYEPKSNANIVIIKLDAVGDVLRTTSILPSLKKKYPESRITWITKKKSYPVLQDNRYINSIYFSEDNLQNIFSHNFGLAINLDNGKESCTIMGNIQAEQKAGYTLINGIPFPVNEQANEWYLMAVNDNVKKENEKTYHTIIHEICGLENVNSRPILHITDEKRSKAQTLKAERGIDKFADFVLINLGGGNRWQLKKWTKEGYAELINKLSQNKKRAIGVIGGEEEKRFYDDVVSMLARSKNIIKLGYDNSTEDFINLIYLSSKVFTSDSLAFHIAAALEKYVVVIVGPTSYAELEVFGKGEIVYSSEVDCLVCYLNKCGKVINCMNTISAESILQLLN